MTEQEPSIDCPLCGETIQQVASATLSLALWQHVNWRCPKQQEIAQGDIVQINPDVTALGGCLLVVTDVRPWGYQGYIRTVTGCIGFYSALKEEVRRVGKVVWSY